MIKLYKCYSIKNNIVMNNKISFVMISYNGIFRNVMATPKIISGITSNEQFLLHGFYDNEILSNINYRNILFIYSRKLDESNNDKVNSFELPRPKPCKLPKIYGDIFLFMFNSNNYMYEDLTKDMWDIISIKK